VRILGEHRGDSGSRGKADRSYYEADSLDEDSIKGFGGYSEKKKSAIGHRTGSNSNSLKTTQNANGRSSPSSSSHIHSYHSTGDLEEKNYELQNEVERLKTKVNQIVESAEISLSEAIESQNIIKNEYNNKIIKKDIEVEHILTENIVLKDIINKLQYELKYEKEQVKKSLRFMDRVKSMAHRNQNSNLSSILDKNIFKQNVKQY
jgi:hypothetical protein